jgi:hypothetical protein
MGVPNSEPSGEGGISDGGWGNCGKCFVTNVLKLMPEALVSMEAPERCRFSEDALCPCSSIGRACLYLIKLG